MLTVDRVQEILQSVESKNKQYLTQAKEGTYISTEEQEEHIDAVMDIYTLLSSMQVDAHVFDVLTEHRGVISLLLGKSENLVDATYDVFLEIQCMQKEAV